MSLYHLGIMPENLATEITCLRDQLDVKKWMEQHQYAVSPNYIFRKDGIPCLDVLQGASFICPDSSGFEEIGIPKDDSFIPNVMKRYGKPLFRNENAKIYAKHNVYYTRRTAVLHEVRRYWKGLIAQHLRSLIKDPQKAQEYLQRQLAQINENYELPQHSTRGLQRITGSNWYEHSIFNLNHLEAEFNPDWSVIIGYEQI